MSQAMAERSTERLPEKSTVAVSGSTGMIGTALVESLRRDGHHVRRLVRTGTGPNSQHIRWDPAARKLDSADLAGVDAVVHLSGETLAERWTEQKKRRIYESRVPATRLLAEALADLPRPPAVMVSASGLAIYGDRGDEVLDEAASLGTDFLARLGQEWEAATRPAAEAGVRVVNTRFGPVLTPRGGMLQRLLLPFRLGLGARIGSGKQWLSWISLTDVIAAIRFALVTPALRGPVNTVAPNPVRNEEFTRVLGRVLGRPTLFTVPATALRLVYGEMADATILASQRLHPGRLLEAGFEYRHPALEEALRAELDTG